MTIPEADVHVPTVPRAVLLGNNKGGVGKSSIAAAVGIMTAAKGSRVLLVDADPQGNLTTDLGVSHDDGRALAMTLLYGEPLAVVTDVRPNVDLVAGGEFLSTVASSVHSIPGGHSQMCAHIGNALLNAYVSGSYDLILIDSAPGDATILQGLLRIASYLIIPTKTDGDRDTGSIGGAAKIAKRYIQARRDGSQVQFLGMVLFDVNPRATKRNAAKFALIEELLGTSGQPFRSTIRHDAALAEDVRQHRATASELVKRASDMKAERLSALRARKKKGADTDVLDPIPQSLWAKDPTRVSGDYNALMNEILIRITKAETGGN